MDARTRYTKMVIRNNFLKLLENEPINRITVTKICEMSEINRATFYKYYNDPYDLLGKLENELIDELNGIMEKQSEHKNLKTTFTELLRMMKEKKMLYIRLFSENADSSFSEQMASMFYKRNSPDIKALFPSLSESEQQWLYGFITNGCTAVIRQWVKSGMKESEEKTASFIANINTALLEYCHSIRFNESIVNVSKKSKNNLSADVNYMNKVKALINTNPDSSVFTKKDGVSYGSVQSLTYYSSTAGRNTPVNVILPPNYTTDKEYPVLYILHGFYDTQDWMLQDDIALVNMLGNLASSGEAKEMIVVLPYIFCSKDKTTCNAMNLENSLCYDNFINDLKTDLIPFIEQKFSVAKGRENTAITGFSMGGRESLFIGISMSDKFGYVGAVCPAPGLTPSTESWNPGQLATGEVKYDENKGIPYLTFISAGENDRTVGCSPKNYHNLFVNNGNENLFCVIPNGAHNATSVKPHLYNYIKMIFKTE